ncbi:site-2 protease family protein [Lacisediminihabitans sp. G11-30]|uniref:Site-2 protease family protein n=1 Tax=Lacisediminihabitans changchengi TaxID=2787634 RepID=A0A934SLH0_9MICO|nr:site-2 protease family protein [Lacisediminihabitans changchengi]
MLLYIVGIVIVVIGVAISIGLHEIGHLVPAKLFKVRVGQYMIGFGPTLFSRTKGETEYGVKAIPLGGYISMAGMYPPARAGERPLTSGTDAFPAEREYEAEESGRKRGGFLKAMVQDARTASADAIPVGAEDRVFYKLPIWKRIIIMFGGPFMNLVIAFVLFGIILSGFGVQTLSVGSVSQCVVAAPSTRTSCEPTDPIAPAAAAGLKPGDQIVKVGSLDAPTWEQVTALIRKSSGKPLDFTVIRNGETKTLAVTPLRTSRETVDSAGKVVKDSAGNPVTVKVGFIGVAPSYPLVKQPFGNALPTLGNNIGHDFQIIGTLPQRLVQVAQAAFGTEARDPNGPVGVVGVGRLAGEVTATQGVPWVDRISFLLGLIASLNVALFAFNMIPLLPLDGGHIIGAIWEGLRKTFNKIFHRADPGPVDIARLVPLTYVVVIVLGGMSLLLVYADIVKPIQLQ